MEYLPIFSIILSLLSFAISLLVYKKFHPREIEKKQIELVLELIKELHNHFVVLNFTQINDNNVINTYKSGNLFNLTDNEGKIKELENPVFQMLEKEMPDFSNLRIYVPEDHEKIFNIGLYLSNPLLPQKIAHNLNKSFRFRASFTKKNDLKGEFILLQESKLLDSKMLKDNNSANNCEYYSSNFANYGEFIEGIKQLKIELHDWLKSKGLKDLNIHWKEPRFY